MYKFATLFFYFRYFSRQMMLEMNKHFSFNRALKTINYYTLI